MILQNCDEVLRVFDRQTPDRTRKPSASGNRGTIRNGVTWGQFWKDGEAINGYYDSGSAARFFVQIDVENELSVDLPLLESIENEQ